MKGTSGVIQRNILILVICFILFAVPHGPVLWAQETETDRTAEQVQPEEPDLELPAVVLEYTAIQREDLEVVLPGEDFIALPELAAQLPQAERMGIGSGALDVPVPAQPEPESIGATRFFSEGVIGGGTDNHLIGDIALYKRGDLPLFQFRFSHEGIDGYGDNSPGEGYFDRREELSGGLELGTSDHSLRLDGDYLEKETGLQDFTGAVSVIHRFLSSSGEYRYKPGSPFSMTLSLDGHSGSQYIGAQERERELYLDSRGAAAYEWERFLLGAGAEYSYQEAPADRTLQQGELYLETAFYGNRFDIGGKAGLHWDEENQFLFPWNLRLEGAAGEKWQYRLEGGYLVRDVLYRDLWDHYSLLAAGDMINVTRGWDASLYLGFTAGSRLRLGCEAGWSRLSGVPLPVDLDNRDAVSGLFLFTLGETEDVELETSAVFSFSETLELKGSWTGLLLYDTERFDPAHRIAAALSYEHRGKGFGAGLNGEYRLEPADSLPIIGAYLQYRLSDGIQLVLDGSDLLGPFYEDGRPWWGEYESRGFHITLKTEISL